MIKAARDQLAEAGEKFRGSRAMLAEDQRTLAALIREAHADGMTVTRIAEVAGVSRPTVYKALSK